MSGIGWGNYCSIALVSILFLVSPAFGEKSDAAPDRDRAEAQVKVGSEQLRRGNLHGALDAFQKANQLDASDPTPLLYMGAIAFKQENWPLTIKSCEAYLALDKTSDDATLVKARLEKAKNLQAIDAVPATQPAGQASVAVVNLDQVARDLGWQAKLGANLETYRTKLQSDVRKYNQIYSDQIKQETQSMVPPGNLADEKATLTPSQSQQLSNLVASARQQVAQVAKSADDSFKTYRLDWIRQYREALAPIIRQVAEERHYKIVLTAGDNVLFADRSVDLTDDVVDLARAKPPTLTEVPMLPVQAPTKIPIESGAGK